MTPQIKQRIEQIRRGEVPEGYKKTKIGVVPTEWEETRFKKMFSRLSRKNKVNNTNVLTISAQQGLISQQDFFNKNIASEDKSNYFLLKKGEFAYNKSYSNGYPFGALKRLDRYEEGVVSPLYICFFAMPENQCPDFYVQYFEAGKMNREIQAFAQEGARNHGLLNISVDDFFNSYLLAPPLAEQERIAEILAAQDRVIELKEKLVEEKKRLKKYLMQQFFSDSKLDKNDFRIAKLGEYIYLTSGYAFDSKSFTDIGTCVIRISNIIEGIVDLSDAVRVQQTGIPLNNVAFKNDMLMAMSGATTGKIGRYINEEMAYVNQRVGKIEFTNAVVDKDYIYQLLCSPIFQKKLLVVLSTGAQPNISSKDIENMTFIVSVDLTTQRKVSKILKAVDQEIDLLQKELDQEKQKKKALMQLLLSGIVRV